MQTEAEHCARWLQSGKPNPAKETQGRGRNLGGRVGPEKWKKRQGQRWNGGSQRERFQNQRVKGPLEN